MSFIYLLEVEVSKDILLLLQAGQKELVLQQTMTLVHRALSLAPTNAEYITEVCLLISFSGDHHDNSIVVVCQGIFKVGFHTLIANAFTGKSVREE